MRSPELDMALKVQPHQVQGMATALVLKQANTNPNGIAGEKELENIFLISKVQSFPSIQAHKCYFIFPVPLPSGQFYWTSQRNKNLILWEQCLTFQDLKDLLQLRAGRTKADNLISQCWLLNSKISSSLWSTQYAFYTIPLFHFSLTIKKKSTSYWKWVGSCVAHTDHNYQWKEGATCPGKEPEVCRLHGFCRVCCAHPGTSLTGPSLHQREHLQFFGFLAHWIQCEFCYCLQENKGLNSLKLADSHQEYRQFSKERWASVEVRPKPRAVVKQNPHDGR